MGSSNPGLEVSVSFGRFANDSSLSWEKWSTFSPNKYLEEVEKCATPGSVAEKKAYFEEYYKQIASRKAEAELLAQEKPLETESECFDSDGQSCEDLVDESIGQCSDERDNQVLDLVSEEICIHYNEPEMTKNCENSRVEGVEKNMDSKVEIQEKCEIEITMETPKLNKQAENAAHEPGKDIANASPNFKDKDVKLGHLDKSHKITPVNKDRNERVVKRKPASPITKTPPFSTPRAPKPTSSPTTLSAAGTRSKKGSNLSNPLQKTKNPSVLERKKMAPRSLHMSLSIGPPGSGPASAASTRKSLIMEKMGDKDIVKRAFKTFQNNYNQLKPSSQEQPLTTKQVPAKGRESRSSALKTLQKENAGSSRVSGIEKKNAKAPPSYCGLKSDGRTERRKEVSKELEDKSNGRGTERKKLQAKSKDNKDAEIKKVRRSLNFKATPLPGFYHGQRTPKSPLNKMGTKSDIHR